MTPKGRTFDLAEVMREQLDKAQPIEIPAGGKVFRIPAVAFWPDAVYESTNIEGAKMLLGKQYDKWCATAIEIDGVTYHGNAEMLFAAISKRLGATIPESQASTD